MEKLNSAPNGAAAHVLEGSATMRRADTRYIHTNIINKFMHVL